MSLFLWSLLLLSAVDGGNLVGQLRGHHLTPNNHETDLSLVDGFLQPGNVFVGSFTSQLQSLIDDKFEPVRDDSLRSASIVNGTSLRYLRLKGHYFADVPLNLPSLFVFKLEGSLKPAANMR